MMLNNVRLSSQLLLRLSKLTIKGPGAAAPPLQRPAFLLRSPTAPMRLFASDTEGGDGKKNANSSDDDPFGVNFEDGDEPGKLGPSSELPPEYKRDAATGKLTGDVIIKLTDEERKVLQADPVQREKLLLKRIVQSWSESKISESGQSESLNDFARRVRFANMGLNVIGRSVQAQESKTTLENGVEVAKDETGFSEPLTHGEFESLKKYMEKDHQIEVSEYDIPVQSANRNITKMDNIAIQSDAGSSSEVAEDADNPDLSLKWMTKRAQWEVNRTGYGGPGEDDPFADLLPGELKPTRLVNRKRAKLLPRELLHHNNLSLLRRYLTPTGQIMNRVHSRLGAKDQRKVAKLIKRARNLGLIPGQGQFVVEDHGDIFEDDIHEDKWWEKELKRRGLVIDDSKVEYTTKNITDIEWVEDELKRRGRITGELQDQDGDKSN